MFLKEGVPFNGQPASICRWTFERKWDHPPAITRNQRATKTYSLPSTPSLWFCEIQSICRPKGGAPGLMCFSQLMRLSNYKHSPAGHPHQRSDTEYERLKNRRNHPSNGTSYTNHNCFQRYSNVRKLDTHVASAQYLQLRIRRTDHHITKTEIW